LTEALFQRPLPKPAGPLSWQRAFQFPEASGDCSSAHHAPTSPLLLYSLPPFPLYVAFRRSLAGRDSREYYDGSVLLLLAQGGVSRILTYSTSLARFRCPFASFNGITSHRFPKRAFHWSAQSQCISHPSFLDAYFGNVATGAMYNDGRGFRRW
jgi:hypothetical protein